LHGCEQQIVTQEQESAEPVYFSSHVNEYPRIKKEQKQTLKTSGHYAATAAMRKLRSKSK
jgi:hypothetical protein